MAGERDQAGTPGAGLNAGGRGMEGMPDAGIGDPGRGSAEVRSGLHSGTAGGGDAYAGLGFAGGAPSGTTGGRASELGASEEAENLIGRARHLAEGLGHRAGDAASAARERVSGLRDRTNRVLEKRGVVDRLRENPLPVLGIAFAIGFLVAGTDDRHSDSRAARARRELRSALMAGLSAGIAQGVRSFLNETGNEGSGFVSSLLDNLAGEGSDRGEAPYGRSTPRSPRHQESF
jgi:hypothetical protein